MNQSGKAPNASMDNQKDTILNSRSNQAAKSTGPDNRSHHATLNMSSHMISARQGPGGVQAEH